MANAAGSAWGTAEWVFVPQTDSMGGDILQSSCILDPDNFEEAIALAETLQPKCVAFNTDGWFKHFVRPIEFWSWGWSSANPARDGLWVRRSTLRGLEWQFFPGVESPGQDAAYYPELAGSSSVLKYHAVLHHPNCVAFNTDGWIKHTLRPKEEWTALTPFQPNNGLWVKKSALDGLEWDEVVGKDSLMYDFKRVVGPQEAIKLAAQAQGDTCLAYNSLGWLKHNLTPRDDWIDAPGSSMWVKKTAISKLGWEFHPYLDSVDPDQDLEEKDDLADDPDGLLAYVAQHYPKATAFNTNGVIKRAALPREKWTSFGNSPYRGLWVKHPNTGNYISG